MIKVGLTGNIGTGKTVVAGIFEALGIPVFHADEEARKFFGDKEVITILTDRFGKQISVNNKIDRKKLASIVFQDKKALDFLNSIIHPLVRKELFAWLDRQGQHAYIMHEAAILFESGFYKEFDKVITIVSPVELTIKRVMARDNSGREAVEKRILNQWDQDKKIALSDFIIQNDERHLIIPQVLKIHQSLIN